MHRLTGLITGLGLLLAVGSAASMLGYYGLSSLGDPANLYSLFLNGGLGGSIAVGGYWLDRSRLDPARYRRALTWMLGGAGGFLSINLAMMYFFPVDDPGGYVGWGLFAAGVGGAAGLLVGIVEARAIQRELAAERAAIRAETAETQRQWLSYLNSLLRHEILNDANVIEGYASILLEIHDDDDLTRNRLETIRRRSQDMTGVIDDVRDLLDAAEGSTTLETTDLGAVVERELDALRANHGATRVETELDLRDEPYVRGDDLLPRVFSNLLSNAVEHNDSTIPWVGVTVWTEDDAATVRIADNGPGIPEEERTALFERSETGTHGMGLFLVRMLVTRYGGSVELTRTGPEGTVFTVSLPTVPPPQSSPRGAPNVLVT